VTTKTLWIYLAILLFIAGFWATSRFFWPPKTGEEENPLLFKLVPGVVREIQWKRGDEVIQLKKEKTWEIRKPLTAPADPGVVEGVLQGLESLRPERKLAESVKEVREFGLDSPSLILSFLVETKWKELRIGAKNPGGNAYYAMTSESPALYLVDHFRLKELDRNLLALRDKRLFSLALEQVQALEVSRAEKKFQLDKIPTGWRSPENPRLVLGKEKVEAFISDLLWSQARDFSGSGQDGSAWQLNRPRATIRVTGGEKGQIRETLLLGMTDPVKGLSGRSSRHKDVLFLDPGFLGKIPEGPEAWEEKPAPAPVT
jgi:hypothetical protein